MDYYNYKDPWSGWAHAYLIIGAIFCFHFITILFYISGIFGLDVVSFIRTGDRFFDKFIVAPLHIIPIYIILFIYHKRNKDLIKLRIESYKQEGLKLRRKKGVLVVLYLAITIILVVSSIFIPFVLKSIIDGYAIFDSPFEAWS
jgi:hypothetical protein